MLQKTSFVNHKTVWSRPPDRPRPQDVRLHPRDVRAVLAGRQGQGGGVQRRGRHSRERGAARQLHDQEQRHHNTSHLSFHQIKPELKLS